MEVTELSIVEFPLETEKQARKMTEDILKNEFAMVTRIYTTFQQWKELGKENEVFGAETVIVRCRVKTDKVDELYKFVKENHPWDMFCFDVMESSARSE